MRTLHSEKLRAKETTEILASTLHPSEGVSEISGLAPEGDPLLVNEEVETEGGPLILVGHLPYLEQLLSLLVNRNGNAEAVSFSTGTVICLSQEKARWKIQWALHPDSV
jgi:phosphohistidine phosphatase